ncbi:fam-a protein [Plasmodium vinckei brucechwatti]|uniref:Fam-a protein n=1 Tax=Plasmodium vinckei brucechwatti TaxID=119398 RepID=A0A6V7SMR3_PLAVN|nr:fam-a protein [Plasmodium vinckei brucechwatti]
MNKFYIQIALFLLSIFAYANNETLAAEHARGKARNPKTRYPTSEKTFIKNPNRLYTDSIEARQATNLTNYAAQHLQNYIKSNDYYKCITTDYPNDNMTYYKKKRCGNNNLKKITYRFENPKMYNSVINRLWDLNHKTIFDTSDVERKIVRVYNPNLVIIQKRYKSCLGCQKKYYYAVAAKIKVSENVTIIAMASADINDHHPSQNKYENHVLGSGNSLTTEINSENDIREGKLKKTFLNVGGYYIEKKYDSYINVAYFESINERPIVNEDELY